MPHFFPHLAPLLTSRRQRLHFSLSSALSFGSSVRGRGSHVFSTSRLGQGEPAPVDDDAVCASPVDVAVAVSVFVASPAFPVLDALSELPPLLSVGPLLLLSLLLLSLLLAVLEEEEEEGSGGGRSFGSGGWEMIPSEETAWTSCSSGFFSSSCAGSSPD